MANQRTVQGHLIDSASGAIIVPNGIEFSDGTFQNTAAQTFQVAVATFGDFPAGATALASGKFTNIQTEVPSPAFSLDPGTYMIQADLLIGGASQTLTTGQITNIAVKLQLANATAQSSTVLRLQGVAAPSQGVISITTPVFEQSIVTTDTYDRMIATCDAYSSDTGATTTVDYKVQNIKFFKLAQ